MQKIFKRVGLIVALIVIHLYFYSSKHIEKIDYEFYDFMSKLTYKMKKQEDDFYTVVVDIDEKTLEKLGQWPLPRVLDAELIDVINGMNPSAIGVNILFSEPDRVSPLYVQKFYKDFFDLNLTLNTIPDTLKDNDALLASSLLQSQATLSTYFNNRSYSSEYCQGLSYQKNKFKNEATKLQATGFLCNYQPLQEATENFGFINAWSDSDGILRRVPLWMEYQQQIFPSFALATLLSFDPNVKIEREESSILINFSEKKPKVFSAIDILRGQIPASEIQGKIVIVGASVVGLTSNFIIPSGDKIQNSMINAIAIDNILTHSYLQQPLKYKKINVLFSFIFLLGVIFLVSTRRYFALIILFLVVAVMSFLWTFDAYLNGFYISIAYFWIPSFYIFLLIILYHARVLSREKYQQEKLLIKQSKLASMGEMISLIAHQWRQPLSAINGIVLNMDIDDRKKKLQGKRLDEHLTNIENTTAYLSKTINDFTNFFSTNERENRFQIEDIIEQTLNLASLVNHKEIDVFYEKNKNISLCGYQSELIQSLLIILNNALYACLDNLSETQKGKIYIRTYSEKKSLMIEIEDNGGGIAKENIYKIFNPYFTTKDESSGTGLGLYILKLIVEDSMNGKVMVYNGKFGAVFTLQIPLTISKK